LQQEAVVEAMQTACLEALVVVVDLSHSHKMVDSQEEELTVKETMVDQVFGMDLLVVEEEVLEPQHKTRLVETLLLQEELG
jgi:hypothetical protein